ncbi:DUF378 domain-containing protein [Clostridium saccharobutylicum]|uniref:DUF378 domain-containing protein n=2 Tax=Clostridium saccharobutylicum TaxID=169679 RepID=U5MRH6_CLOSA|nr:DUF378 domain-containing protein [Clostridium saccharobutylicum]AGX42276.1 hypothetical protein CLSA_c12730 [Clostridium saccharobutylicum DSM 13864]AQR89557.1 hypothetical protein CLOSC_12600 [Clostridium saccharobutylicum]AQR99459.1 hypothetical protein CSACC_12680 [Clostridium saccharobutylicum]AQS13445.1 hypothetical protein CLOSACC_12680 [Clostridium saccharobutylicum]MBA2904365.1 hypothetical protein [Clostridium saccharobutylicum]
MKVLDSIALLLMIIGGVNWGLISFFQFNLVSSLFGSFSSLTRIIYALVGIASLYSISFFAKERAS